MKLNVSIIGWFGVLLLAGAIPVRVMASKAPSLPPLPNFDHRAKGTVDTTPISPEQQEASKKLRESVRGARVDFDPALGRPWWVGSTEGFLSGPQGAGGAISAATANRFAPSDPHRATKAFLAEHRALFGHGPEVLETARVTRDYVTPHNGMHSVVWEQQVGGVGVFEGYLISHTTKDGELVSISRNLPIPLPGQARDLV